MGFIFIVGLIVLIYFGYQFLKAKKQYNNPIEKLKKLYADKHTDSDQIKTSYFILASRFSCLPEKVKDNYFLKLEKNNLSYSQLLEEEKNWHTRKFEEAEHFGIKPENTPTTLLEKWTQEFRNNNL